MTPAPKTLQEAIRKMANDGTRPNHRTHSEDCWQWHLPCAALYAADLLDGDAGLTGAQRYFQDRLKDPEYRASYEDARSAIEDEVNAKLIRDILVAMARKQGISLVSPFNPDEEARNYMLAQRLGIGSVFGIPDDEEPDDV
jgi:hypothetical protein